MLQYKQRKHGPHFSSSDCDDDQSAVVTSDCCSNTNKWRSQRSVVFPHRVIVLRLHPNEKRTFAVYSYGRTSYRTH